MKKNKLLAVLLALVMTLSLLPTAALAEETVPTEVDSYESLLSALERGENVKLKTDITTEGSIGVSEKTVSIDLNQNTLTVNEGNNFDNANVTISNGNLCISGASAAGNAIFCLGISNPVHMTLNNVNVIGNGYSSAFAVFYLNVAGSVLDINGGSVNVKNDTHDAGGVFKGTSGSINGQINITGTSDDPVELTFNNAKIGFLDGTVNMNYVNLSITGGANAINQSAMTINNSTLTVTGCDGRALTPKHGNITVTNSILNFSEASEGEIRFKGNVELNLDANSTLNECTIYADPSVTGAKVNGITVIGTENEKSTVTVEDGTAAIVPANTVAVVSGIYYPTLAAAIAAAEDNDIITMLKDVDVGDGIIVQSGSNLTIDFAGHTYTVTQNLAGSSGTESQCFQLLKNSTIKMKNGTIRGNNANVKMLIQNYSNLTLEDMTLDTKQGTNNVLYTLSNNNGNISIIGNTSINAPAGKIAFDVCWNKANYAEGANVTVNTTGTIDGDVELGLWNTTAPYDNAPSNLTIQNGKFTGAFRVDENLDGSKLISITGGTFSSDPSAYKGESTIVRINDGATYTVVTNSNLKSGTYLTIPSVASGYRYTGSEGAYVVSRIPSSSNDSSNANTETTKNPDGSTTTTTTDKATGTVTETTKDTDGTTTTVETQKDGTVTETVKTPEGTTGTVVTDKDGGITEIKAAVTSAAVSAAEKSGEAVTLPVEVPAAASTEAAPAVEITVPKASGSVKVEIPVEQVTPGTVAVIVKADGTEEIVKTSVLTEDGVALTLDDSATVKIIDNAKDFGDTNGHWAEDAISFVSAREIFTGTSTTTFTPNAPMTRAQLMTVLASFDGQDTTGGSVWYETGMEWAVANGVSDGSDPNGSITREQLATMLWRYAGSPVVEGGIDSFHDAGDVSGYAADAMRWAVEIGLISGVGDNTLDPQGNATRAQLAVILMNYCGNLTK